MSLNPNQTKSEIATLLKNSEICERPEHYRFAVRFMHFERKTIMVKYSNY